MLATNYSNYRQNLKNYCDKATYDFETIIVTRKNDENIVVMSESEYNNLIENLFVRSNKKSYDRLMNSIENLKKGNYKIMELLEDE